MVQCCANDETTQLTQENRSDKDGTFSWETASYILLSWRQIQLQHVTYKITKTQKCCSCECYLSFFQSRKQWLSTLVQPLSSNLNWKTKSDTWIEEFRLIEFQLKKLFSVLAVSRQLSENKFAKNKSPTQIICYSAKRVNSGKAKSSAVTANWQPSALSPLHCLKLR